MLKLIKKAFAAAILFAFMLGLSACGQKGDLYHPPEVKLAKHADFHNYI